jgi:transposase
VFLQQQLCANGISPQAILVVLEATGSYWITLATTLAEAGFAVSAINPAQAHDFAKALLKRAKTDDLDAQMLSTAIPNGDPVIGIAGEHQGAANFALAPILQTQ